MSQLFRSSASWVQQLADLLGARVVFTIIRNGHYCKRMLALAAPPLLVEVASMVSLKLRFYEDVVLQGDEHAIMRPESLATRRIRYSIPTSSMGPPTTWLPCNGPPIRRPLGPAGPGILRAADPGLRLHPQSEPVPPALAAGVSPEEV